MPRTLSLAAAVSAVLALSAAPALAGDAPSRRIDFTTELSFDRALLADAAGAKAVHRSLVSQARNACYGKERMTLEANARATACAAQIVDEAVRRIGSIELAAAHRDSRIYSLVDKNRPDASRAMAAR